MNLSASTTTGDARPNSQTTKKSKTNKTSQVPRCTPYRKGTSRDRDTRTHQTISYHMEKIRPTLENRQVLYQDKATILERSHKHQTHVRTRNHVPYQNPTPQTRHIPTKRPQGNLQNAHYLHRTCKHQQGGKKNERQQPSTSSPKKVRAKARARTKMHHRNAFLKYRNRSNKRNKHS